MHLITLILGIVLLPKVTSLKCYQCMGAGACASTEMICSSGQSHCAALSAAVYAGGQKLVDFHAKFCAVADDCIEGSINYGVIKTEVTSRCCSSDLCNNQTAPEPERKSPNGNQCYYCDGNTCDLTLDCEGEEDRCISATVIIGNRKRKGKGCATSLMCRRVDDPQIKEIIGEDVRCCQGSFCNSAIKTSAGLLMLPVILISLVVFS